MKTQWILICLTAGLAVQVRAQLDITAATDDVQRAIDAAPSNSVLRCDPNHTFVLSKPIAIRKPLTLTGLRARLADKVGLTSLLVVEARGVAITDFELTGNADTVPQKDRAPLVVIHRGDFRVERGVFLNSSKDGVMIDGDGSPDEDITGGIIRDIVGRGVRRDVVSISGSSGSGRLIRNVLVDNVRCYGSEFRGAVEVSDGTDNITVRKVWAEDSVYAVDVQDHGRGGQANRNVLVQDVYATRCKHALRTANSRKGHANLTIREITADNCRNPIQISHTDHVLLSGVRVLNHTNSAAAISVSNCRGVTIRDVLLDDANTSKPGVLIENCHSTLIDGVQLRNSAQLGSAVCFRTTTAATYSGLRICNVSAPEIADAIVLESRKGTLTDYLITGNLGRVADMIKGERGIIER